MLSGTFAAGSVDALGVASGSAGVLGVGVVSVVVLDASAFGEVSAPEAAASAVIDAAFGDVLDAEGGAFRTGLLDRLAGCR